ncbi:MAG: 4-hydroxy-tetrahydrodipicolinate synthase [Candidatus Omnitrophica bacterium]|nr:4-hydroxy-tetrahydrodipicolinate synthase [Candidatus Omnitrophota bacterium]
MTTRRRSASPQHRQNRWQGSMVALVTPFRRGSVDEPRLRQLIEWHIAQGTSAIVPCGTTGESATLSMREHEQVIDLCVQAARGRVPVIPGTGSNNTAEAVELTKFAERTGADAALVISPYYNKPTQQGLFLHFKAVAEAVELPIIVYNIASRTAVNIEPETMARIAEIKQIVGVKEASGNLEQMSRIRQLCGERFALISGDDALTLPILAIGGTGVISVVANLVPSLVAAMIRVFQDGNVAEARKWHAKLLPLTRAMFLETNPIPVKTAMGMLGMIEPELRLPLCAISEVNHARLQQALIAYGLLTPSGAPSGAWTAQAPKPTRIGGANRP